MADTPTDDHTAATAIAGGAIAIGLFNALIDKEVISKAEALSVLREAQDFLNSPNTDHAARIVGSLYELILNGN
ncbi:MAG: hypothetical protein JO051_00840 [Acidobacteriaceae bacterium]|nr:hypothetical protein [Acidobacteriaceae bacterium]